MMKKIILVLGSTGMLGHQVLKSFLNHPLYQVIDISFRKKFRDETLVLDATNQHLLDVTIRQIKPNFIINCVGILIKGSSDMGNSIYLNAYLPHQLANIANQINAKLMHISTDCVFSGRKGSYVESDYRDGQSIYAQTKILGEVTDDRNLTLRTSIIGPELKENGEGLLHWFMQQKGVINGFNNVFWSGVSTLELAKIILWSIEKKMTGLHHITNNKSISKKDLLELFNQYSNKKLTIESTSLKDRVDKTLIDTQKIIDYQMPTYKKMVSDMFDDMKNNQVLYPYNFSAL